MRQVLRLLQLTVLGLKADGLAEATDRKVAIVDLFDQSQSGKEENSRDDSAVGAKLGLIISVFAVFAHQVVRMRPVRLVLGHQVNPNFPFSTIIQNLQSSRERTR